MPLKGYAFQKGWRSCAFLQTRSFLGLGLCLGWDIYKTHNTNGYKVVFPETLALCFYTSQTENLSQMPVLLVKRFVLLLCSQLGRACEGGDVWKVLHVSWLKWMVRGSNRQFQPLICTVVAHEKPPEELGKNHPGPAPRGSNSVVCGRTWTPVSFFSWVSQMALVDIQGWEPLDLMLCVISTGSETHLFVMWLLNHRSLCYKRHLWSSIYRWVWATNLGKSLNLFESSSVICKIELIIVSTS